MTLTVRYIKHSEKTVRYDNRCKECGTAELYWAHEQVGEVTPATPGYCEIDKSVGTLVLVDVDTLQPHSCIESQLQLPPKPADDIDSQLAEAEANAATALETSSLDEKPDFPQRQLSEWMAEAIAAAQQNDDIGEDHQPPCSDDDEPVLHSELNEFDPVSHPQLTDTLLKFRGVVQDGLTEVATVLNNLNENDRDHIEMIKALNTKQDALQAKMETLATTIVIHDKETGEDQPIEGLQHRQLADAIIILKSGQHLLMVAAAGCGKGKIARQSAQALGLRFLSLPGSLSPQTPVSTIIGYMNSSGKYIRSLFREAFENGGLIFLDELDNAHPACIAAVNDALSISEGEKIAFPDKMVKRHKDFKVAAAANTFGRGPDRTYAARQRGDAATWDRFAILTLVYDHALEDVLCKRVGLDQDMTVNIIRFVRSLRTNVEKHQQTVPVVIGMRASIGMCELIHAGMSLEGAIEARCRRGMSDQDWKKITYDVLPLTAEAERTGNTWTAAQGVLVRPRVIDMEVTDPWVTGGLWHPVDRTVDRT